MNSDEKSEAFYKNSFSFELRFEKKIFDRVRVGRYFLIIFFDTKTNKAKPSKFAIRLFEANPSVTEHS